MRGSSASIASLVQSAGSSSLSEMETLSSAEPIETVASIVDERLVPPVYDIPRDEL